MTWTQIVKTTTPLSDLKEEMDTLLKIRSYQIFEGDNEGKELMEKMLKVLQWKWKKEIERAITEWEKDKKSLGEN